MTMYGYELTPPPKRWECANCNVTHQTTEVNPHTPFHQCAGLKGLTAPLTEFGVRSNVTAVEREDYVGSEIVHTDGDGRPKMAVVTERDDGQDVAVLVPAATGKG